MGCYFWGATFGVPLLGCHCLGATFGVPPMRGLQWRRGILVSRANYVTRQVRTPSRKLVWGICLSFLRQGQFFAAPHRGKHKTDWLSQLAETAESEAKRPRQKLSLLTLGYFFLPSPRLSCPRHGRASVGRLFSPLESAQLSPPSRSPAAHLSTSRGLRGI